jgi:integrase
MYQGHIRLYFRRLLDGVLLRELHIGHAQDAFQQLFDEGMTAATARRLFSTLRSALNAAVRERLIPDNPARYLKPPKGRRPFAVVWTKRRVREWRRTGERPVVAVWTPAQLAEFLSAIAGHPLFAVCHLIAMRGLRRGEACGLTWDDLDLDEGVIYISRQLQQGAGGQLRACPLKTESSRRVVALDPETIIVLRAHRSRQERHFIKAGITPRGWVFTREDGEPLSPSYLTHKFSDLVEETGMPPIRLHDLRHGAATLMLLAGEELKTIRRPAGPLQRRADRRHLPQRRRRARPECGRRCRATGPEGGQEPAGRRQRPQAQRSGSRRDHRLTIRHPRTRPVTARGPTLPERPEGPAAFSVSTSRNSSTTGR